MCTKFLMSDFLDTYLAPLSFDSQLYRPTSHGDYVALFYIATYSTQVTCSSVDYFQKVVNRY